MGLYSSSGVILYGAVHGAVQLFGKLFYMELYSSSVVILYFIWGCTALC